MDLLAIISDTQIPFQDESALKITREFIRGIQPTHLYIIGDWGDFYAISSHARDPSRVSKLSEEIKEQVGELEKFVKVIPNAKRIFIEGNHEDRLRRYLWHTAPELKDIGGLTIPELLHLSELGFEHVAYPYGKFHNKYESFFLMHGDVARRHSAYTARAMMDRFGVSGINGHTHRLGTYYRRDVTGPKVWLENGCLCLLEPGWTAYPDWQHGFTLVHVDRDRFHAEQIPIIGGKFMYGGKLYGG